MKTTARSTGKRPLPHHVQIARRIDRQVLCHIFGFKGALSAAMFFVFVIAAIASGTPQRKDDNSAVASAFGLYSVTSFAIAFVACKSDDED
jgi:hypothetical protein